MTRIPTSRPRPSGASDISNLSSEAPRLEELFDDEEFRSDALFAYALSVPGETSPGRVRALMTKVEEAAGGFREDEEDLVRIALDQRLMLHGKSPVFFPDEAEEEESETVIALAQTRPQRSVFLRQRQEVQEVPRPGELSRAKRVLDSVTIVFARPCYVTFCMNPYAGHMGDRAPLDVIPTRRAVWRN